MADSAKDTIVVTPVGRLNFPYLFRANPRMSEKKDVFSCRISWQGDSDLRALEKAWRAVAKEKWGDRLPKFKQNPIRTYQDIESEELEGFDEDTRHLNLKADRWKPEEQCIGRDNEPIGEGHPHGLYAGCYVRAIVRPYAWDNDKGKGISWDMLGIQKIKDGEPFGTVVNARKAFEEVPLDDDDFDDDDDAADELLKKYGAQ